VKPSRKGRNDSRHRRDDGCLTGRPLRSLTADEGHAHFEWLAHFVAIDNPSSSALTRTGMQPKELGLLMDMRECGYFL
jgi:hypothetical protein